MRSWGEGDWNQTLSATYYQFAWHHILHPSDSITYDGNNMPTADKFVSSDSAMQTVDTLRFQAFESWSLNVPDSSFVKAPKTSGNAGYVTLILSLEPNTDSKERSTTLTLTSASGVNTPVTYRQAAKKEK